MSKLRISETFFSLQGETTYAGLPTYFIRLTGCPLRCTYCDSEYAFTGGENYEIKTLIDMAAKEGMDRVCVTGGEPLAQPACKELLTGLCDQGLFVSLETSGAMDIQSVDSRVCVILDLKTPGSNESHRNLWENLIYLKAGDQIKFVITSELDYQWAKNLVIEKKLLNSDKEVLFSPSFEQVEAKNLAQWILNDKLPVRMQMQMHKYIWGDIPGV